MAAAVIVGAGAGVAGGGGGRAGQWVGEHERRPGGAPQRPQRLGLACWAGPSATLLAILGDQDKVFRARPLPAPRGCWQSLQRGQGRRERGEGTLGGPASSCGLGGGGEADPGQTPPPRGLGLASPPPTPASLPSAPLLCAGRSDVRAQAWSPVTAARSSQRSTGVSQGSGRDWEGLQTHGPPGRASAKERGAARREVTGLSAARALLKLKEPDLKMPFCFLKIIKNIQFVSIWMLLFEEVN